MFVRLVAPLLVSLAAPAACGDEAGTPAAAGLVVSAVEARACELVLADLDPAAAPEVRLAADVAGEIVREAPHTAIAVMAVGDVALGRVADVVGGGATIVHVRCYDRQGRALAASASL